MQYDSYISIPHKRKRKSRKLVIFGRSIPLAAIFVFAVVVTALAALFIYLTLGISGSIISAEEPTLDAAFTNDDGVVDHGVDGDDDGTDPKSAWISDGPGIGHAERQVFDLQSCTIVVSDVTLSSGYETATGPSYCTVFMDLTNSTGADLELVSVSITDAPLEIAPMAGVACGFSLPDSTSTMIGFDINVVSDALGGAFGPGTIDIEWAFPGTYTCP